MISPNTAPGTKVVCVDDRPGAFRVAGYRYSNNLDGLKAGEKYTIKEIAKNNHPALSEYCAVLVEISRDISNLNPNRKWYISGFHLARFRYLDLPESLTRLCETLKNTEYESA